MAKISKKASDEAFRWLIDHTPRLPAAIAGIVLTASLSTWSTGADAIVLDGSNNDCEGSQTSQNDILGELEGSECADATLSKLYKDEVNGEVLGEESGDFSEFYETVFGPEDVDVAQDAQITHEGGTKINRSDYIELWALAKDGNANPAWYAWDLIRLEWDGTDILSFEGLWPDIDGRGEISNVSIYGAERNGGGGGGPEQEVPLPGVLSLTGLGLALMGFSRRRWKRTR